MHIIYESRGQEDPGGGRQRLRGQLLRSQTGPPGRTGHGHEQVPPIQPRKGLKYNYPENAKIDWLVGDILAPEKFLPQINSADAVVHTVGTLFDSSVTKGTAPGGPGTYEQVNRDTFASLLANLQSPKRVVYLSSNGHPPFL